MKLLALTTLSMFLSFSAFAKVPYTKEAFERSQEKGEKVMLQAYASWCPVCKNEDKVFANLEKEDLFKNITYYQADFDKESELKKQFKIMSPGTVILFDGKKELRRTAEANTEENVKNLGFDFFGK